MNQFRKNQFEVIQAKHEEKTTDESKLMRERQKAVGESWERNIFVYFTTSETSLKPEQVPKRTILIAKNNWNSYFGPFAGLAFKRIEPEKGNYSLSNM